MNDFLDFLNTADLEAFAKIPGVTRFIADDLVAARPFASAEDCLTVAGMDKELLARMQSAFESGGSALGNSDSLSVKKESPPALVEKKSTGETKPSFSSRFGQAFLNFLQALLKLIATLALIGSVGAAIYFGAPFINKKFIAPVEQNAANVRNLEKEIATLQTQLKETRARVGALEKTIEAQTAHIAQLEAMQATLEKESVAQSNSVMIELKREIMLTRAIETLARARLYLSQSNFGMAKQDVQSTRDILAQLASDAPAHQTDALKQIVARLDLALGNLPAFPVIAVDDIDVAWQLMMMETPEIKASATATPTPTISTTFAFTPTMSPTFTATTPTASPTFTATLTPFIDILPTATP